MKIRKKRSIIWSIPHKELQILLNNSNSIVEVLEKLGLNGYTGNHKTLKERLSKEHFDFTQIDMNRKISRTKLLNSKRRFLPNSEIFTDTGDKVCFSTIKKRIKDQCLFEYKCAECGNTGIHNHKPLSLQVDHINGINTDHRLENLRYLCPNCHSQTETFSGKRLKKERLCVQCGDNTSHHSSLRCKSCNIELNKNRPELEKITWPSNEELSVLIWEKPFSQLSKELGVSDVAIKKRCVKHGIKTPPRGFWLKVNGASGGN